MPHLCKSFSAKEPYNKWLFCGLFCGEGLAIYGILCIIASPSVINLYGEDKEFVYRVAKMQGMPLSS